jgi:penicillin-binding protein 1B
VEESATPRTRTVLDPRVAYLVTTLLEDVVNRGTGVTVRSMGFNAPAAGKTGTSRDGWFAGFTSNLLCVIWIGFDDNRDLGLSGSQSAAPIWADFMKRAISLPVYSNTQEFEPAPGVIAESIDPQTGQLATPSCPQNEQEYFVAGSEPTLYCELHGGSHFASAQPGSWLAHLFGRAVNVPPPPPAGALNSPPGGSNPSNQADKSRLKAKAGQPAAAPGTPTETEPEKKKGFLDRLFGIFGSSKKPADNEKPQP